MGPNGCQQEACQHKETTFLAPLVGPLGQWPPNCEMQHMGETPPVCKISAKSVQQFRRWRIPNGQTEWHLNSKF